MKKGLLSVIIPTYGRSIDLVQKSIESVMHQDYPLIDIYVIDDNPADSVFSEGIQKYCDENSVHYVKQDGNKGACAARNLGIRLSEGEYLGFLDDDDTWETAKARVQIEEFKDTVGLVYCKGYKIDTTFDPPEVQEYYNTRFFKREITYSDLLTRDCIGTTSQVIIHRRCFDTCGGFDEELLARQDYEMWLRISKHFAIAGADAFLFNHYIHQQDQITKSSYKSLQGYTRIYNLYKKDFRKNKTQGLIILHIIKLAKKNKDYRCLIKFGSLNILYNPISILKKPLSLLKKVYRKIKRTE